MIILGKGFPIQVGQYIGWLNLGDCTSRNWPEGGAATSFDPEPSWLWLLRLLAFINWKSCCVTGWDGLKRTEAEGIFGPASKLLVASQLLQPDRPIFNVIYLATHKNRSLQWFFGLFPNVFDIDHWPLNLFPVYRFFAIWDSAGPPMSSL